MGLPTDTIYSLSDLNLMGRVLTEEFEGTWLVEPNSDGPSLFYATLGTDVGDVTYSAGNQTWWAVPRTASDHEEIVRRFFEAIGIDAEEATRYAGRIVRARSTSSVRSCLGPRALDITTAYFESEWVTYFTPVFSRVYEHLLSPC